MHAWQQQGVPVSTIALHVRTLKAAVGWAFDERLIASLPLQGMRGPSPCAPRRDVPLDVVRQLLTAAEHDVARAAAAPASAHRDRQLHTAEQLQLLLRLAADTGARRGELDAIHAGDLHSRVLHIDRGVSADRQRARGADGPPGVRFLLDALAEAGHRTDGRRRCTGHAGEVGLVRRAR